MKDFLSDKVAYYRSFASAMHSIFMQMRYGVKICSSKKDVELASIRKELADWQSRNDCGLESAISVDAGNDTEITLPTSTGTLSGIVLPENTVIDTIEWTQVSGPSSAIIVSPSELETQVAGLVEGEYVFNLSVTSSLGVTKTDSIILYNPGVAYYYKSTAAIEIAEELGGIYSLISVLKIFPEKLRNYIYDYIAKNRYKWYGKKESCMLPTQNIAHRFLTD